jgi:hypothetical protein
VLADLSVRAHHLEMACTAANAKTREHRYTLGGLARNQWLRCSYVRGAVVLEEEFSKS